MLIQYESLLYKTILNTQIPQQIPCMEKTQ